MCEPYYLVEANSTKKCLTLGADDYVVKSKGGLTDLLVRIPFVVERAGVARRGSQGEVVFQDAGGSPNATSITK